ncbi:hypothetical protein N9N67_04745 [Bacteriovoracaceae bacterium]|nr:hypothetical protein [Bacteriovoracaceae bacterium]
MIGKSYSQIQCSLILLTLLAISCKKPIAQAPDSLPQNESACPFEDEIKETHTDSIIENNGDETQNNCKILSPSNEIHLNSNLEYQNFSEEVELKLQLESVIEKTLKIINSKQFKQAVLNHQYKDEKVFVQNQDLSNEEIYFSLLDGLEILDPNRSPDHEIDLKIKKYYKRTSTIGYTYPSSLVVNINLYHYRKMSEAKMAQNLIHEWTHKLGYKHDRKRTSRRKYSIPYGVGYIIRDLYQFHFLNQKQNNLNTVTNSQHEASCTVIHDE